MNFIRKIFEKNNDELVHGQFVRFSVGDYYPRAVMQIKKIKKNISIKSGFEYANDFIKFIIENVTGEVAVKGKIFSKHDFEETKFITDKKKKKGFKVGIVNTDMPITELAKIYETFVKEYLLLEVTGSDFTLKTSSTPHNPRGKYKDNFCKFKLSGELESKFIQEFGFDIEKEFKVAIINHRFLIKDVKVPKEFENDMAMARLKARRVGKLIRELDIDGETESKEIELDA